jgi:hypothetical protein
MQTNKVNYIKIIKHDYISNAELDENEFYPTIFHDYNILGIEKIVNKNSYYDLCIPFDIIKNKNYYLVYAIYTTADSYRREQGNIEFIDLYINKNKAEDCVNKIKNSKEDSIIIENQNNNNYVFHKPWGGYFDKLESIEIIEISLIKGKIK